MVSFFVEGSRNGKCEVFSIAAIVVVHGDNGIPPGKEKAADYNNQPLFTCI
jgi:hypothetical protein